MRLIDSLVNVDICLSYENPTVLVIEDRGYFSQFIFNLWKQCNGQDGGILLSEVSRSVNLDKSVELIINPFGIKFNDKKILSKVYSELENICNEYYIEELSSINTNIVTLLDLLEKKISYPIHFSLDLDLKGLFKLYDVKIEESEEGLLDNLISYIKLLHQACGVKVVVFVNLKTFLSKDMIKDLYQACFYEEIILIDIETYDFGKEIEAEQYIIIDKDLCFIEI